VCWVCLILCLGEDMGLAAKETRFEGLCNSPHSIPFLAMCCSLTTYKTALELLTGFRKVLISINWTLPERVVGRRGCSHVVMLFLMEEVVFILKCVEDCRSEEGSGVVEVGLLAEAMEAGRGIYANLGFGISGRHEYYSAI